MKQEMKRIRALQNNFIQRILTDEEITELKLSENISYDKVLKMYGESYIKSVEVFAYNNKRFIIAKSDISFLHTGWENTLKALSTGEGLVNPVFVDVESDGQLIIH